jgi:hypothetical protein
MRKEYTKKEILESKKVLNEDFIENALMVAGFIPVIGEVFDIILIIRYIYKKEYLYAGLMLIALIPTVGDFIAKPIIRLLKGAGVAGKIALKSGDDMVRYATTNPQFAKQYVKLGEHLSNPLIGKTINQLDNIPVVGGKAANGLTKSIAEHKTAIQKISETITKSRPVQLGKTIGKEITTGGKFSTGFKKFFQEEKLAQYIAKRGQAPKTWVANWWNVVSPARRGRRNMIKYFVMTNNLLDTFGLPSFDAFSDKIESDEKFREQLANDPRFSQVVNQTTSPEDLSQIENMSNQVEPQSTEQGSVLSNKMGLNMLKMLAQSV